MKKKRGSDPGFVGFSSLLLKKRLIRPPCKIDLQSSAGHGISGKDQAGIIRDTLIQRNLHIIY
jgi:hypothetical protein